MSTNAAAGSRAARLATHRRVSDTLGPLDDQQLGGLLESATAIGSGIGGSALVLEVAGAPVFVKRVALTDLERRTEHVRSTRNIFHLPPFYHYGIGVGSAGFGVWRELAVHQLATGWVLGDKYHGFPLMYHWRILPGAPGGHGDLEGAVNYWDGSSAVRVRLEAIAGSSASVVLFLEYIPLTLDEWLTARIAEGAPAGETAWAGVERSLRAGTSFMRSHGLLHFDAHFQNILTDGRRLYFADFGLALSSGFDLVEDESDFFERHRSYDQAYTATHLVNRLNGSSPLAVVMNEFSRKLQTESRSTPYPDAAAELVRDAGAWSRQGDHR